MLTSHLPPIRILAVVMIYAKALMSKQTPLLTTYTHDRLEENTMRVHVH